MPAETPASEPASHDTNEGKAQTPRTTAAPQNASQDATLERAKREFFEGLEREPALIPDTLAPETPPYPPQGFYIPKTGSWHNYLMLGDNQQWGCTGLVSVVAYQDSCYGGSGGAVQPGAIFLLPGTSATPPPAWNGPLSFECNSSQQPINTQNGALHRQMCNLLNQPTTTFIGFSAWYPLNEQNMGWNSGICNPYWFNGSRTLPPQWPGLIYNTMLQYMLSDSGSHLASA